MDYVELTRPDGSFVFVNKKSIVSISTYGNNIVLLFAGGHRQEVKETYEEIKKLLMK